MITCTAPTNTERRRAFWTTQPGACGTSPGCGADCGVAGLSFTQNACGRNSCSCCPGPAEDPNCASHQRALRQPQPRTFVTTDWIRSLVLNIMLTDGKSPNTKCGYRPGAQGGHWSESFRTDGQKIGTLVRKLPKSNSIRESVLLAKATLVSELSRLITVGVASAVDVEAEYIGNNTMTATISITAPDGTNTRVGMTGTRNANAWAWR